MKMFAIVILGFLLFWIYQIFSIREDKKNKALEKLRPQWAKPKERRRSMEQIALYHEALSNTNAYHRINSKIWKDLNMDAVFAKIDRTTSSIGQQYLYHQLCHISNDLPRLLQLDELIENFREEIEKREAIQLILFSLNDFGAYQTYKLLFEDIPKRPDWYAYLPLLSFASVACAVLSFIIPQAFFILIFLLIANTVIHFRNKNYTYFYRQSLGKLIPLIESSEAIQKQNLHIGETGMIKASLKKVESLKKKIRFFNSEKHFENQAAMPAWAMLEMLKALFVFEPNYLFKTLKEVKVYKEELHQLFKFVGQVDTAISIASVREGSRYFCKPTFSESTKMTIEEAYHPVIDNCITNSLHLEQKSVLLTGSNMSGKTSFIRMVAVNCLLGQTIYTCFAKTYQAPFYKIMTSIQIEDSITQGKSYYFEEVLSIKTLLQKAEESAPCLFIIDEVFKGTNTVERVAAAKAVLSHLANPSDHRAGAKHLVLVSTHDIELTDLLQQQFDLYHFREMIQDEELLFDYKLKKGQLKTRNALKILELNAYPIEVIKEAEKVAQLVEADKKR